MRKHSDILGTSEAIAKAQEVTGASLHTVRSWRQRDSIPGPHWKDFADAGLASLEELAMAARPSSSLQRERFERPTPGSPEVEAAA